MEFEERCRGHSARARGPDQGRIFALLAAPGARGRRRAESIAHIRGRHSEPGAAKLHATIAVVAMQHGSADAADEPETRDHESDTQCFGAREARVRNATRARTARGREGRRECCGAHHHKTEIGRFVYRNERAVNKISAVVRARISDAMFARRREFAAA